MRPNGTLLFVRTDTDGWEHSFPKNSSYLMFTRAIRAVITKAGSETKERIAIANPVLPELEANPHVPKLTITPVAETTKGFAIQLRAGWPVAFPATRDSSTV